YLLLIWPNEDRQHKVLRSNVDEGLEQEQEVTDGQ
ncbi:rod shape-determining protein MreC, partial [Vibrio parahaemolyticus]|nr:rod shape-determining protein MreC [Vibrio parahaemolyticus]